ncbi:YoaK family protein [Sphingobacterium puteale]|uniref:YoaK family protein n=1 Tax=Sphingobacterium puteale TaxID=2420510 RepID=UPI003D97AC18
MFRHRDKGRNYIHNVQLAALLSIVAGVVNIVGVLSFKTLTTNVTGHFAFFSEELYLNHYLFALLSILYVISFLLGAFVANTAMELTSRGRAHFSYSVPISIEIMLLTFVSFFNFPGANSSVWLSCTLLLAMGLQNALVTKISGSVVRTTHLTGLFTDLGIELSQVIFYKKTNERKRLRRGILLKIIIIGGFFFGGIIGAFIYGWLGRKTLLLPVTALLIALCYDRLLLGLYRLKRRQQDHTGKPSGSSK